MTDKTVFDYFLDKIQSDSIRTFVLFALDRTPEYFWSLPASTSGKYHSKNETVVDHTIACLCIAEQVCDFQLKSHWDQQKKDCLYAALILHDTYRCGYPSKELRVTQEEIDRKGLDQSKLGCLKTSREHPEVGYQELTKVAHQYNQVVGTNYQINWMDQKHILDAVRYHYGTFLKLKDFPYDPSWKFDTVIQQVVAIDYHQTMNAMYLSRGKISHS